MLPFLQKNPIDYNSGASDWFHWLCRVFVAALNLKGEMLLWRSKLQVSWPFFDLPFDGETMTVESADDTGFLRTTEQEKGSQQTRDSGNLDQASVTERVQDTGADMGVVIPTVVVQQELGSEVTKPAKSFGRVRATLFPSITETNAEEKLVYRAVVLLQ